MKTNTLSVLVHARSKVGKSTLSATAPLPILVMDAEGGWRFIRNRGWKGKQLRIKHWNPLLEAPPRYDDTWDVCVVTVTDWQTLQMTYVHLTQSPHDFRSIILDSITEVQRRCKANLVGSEQMKIQDWGTLLNRMDTLIRGFRDLNLIASNPIEFVMFIAETRLKDGSWRPMMQGQIDVSLPYWVDICGYLFVNPVADPTDPTGQATIGQRVLLIGGDPQFEAGERVQGRLPNLIPEPDLQMMIDAVFAGGDIEPAVVPAGVPVPDEEEERV